MRRADRTVADAEATHLVVLPISTIVQRAGVKMRTYANGLVVGPQHWPENII